MQITSPVKKELVFMGSGLKRKTGSFRYVIKVTPNLRGCPPEKKFVRALFSRKPPQTIYQQKGYKM